jgi:hypothetical protein
MAIKAIPTRYRGYHFRSRLEARWAVFFETLGVQWEYEPEGFSLDGERYLPDFKVTTGDLVYWYEVKPLGVTGDRKFARFCDQIQYHTEEDGYRSKRWNLEARMLSGDPADVFAGTFPCPRCGLPEDPKYFAGEYDCGTRDHEWVGFLCHECDDVTNCGGDNPWEVGFAGIPFQPSKGWIMTTQGRYAVLTYKISEAMTAARSARFEHGVSGAT